MKAKGKSSDTPCPIWIEGEYITDPPVRPKDGVKRSQGHYIDKGGYPGANVYEVDIKTVCEATGATDRVNKAVYERDILLWETTEGIAYLIVQDREWAVDIVNGEYMEVQQLRREEIKVIGNEIDANDFTESIIYHAENYGETPYIPFINVQLSSMPYFMIQCEKCNTKTLTCKYLGKCSKCGGYTKVGYATKAYRAKEKALA